MSMRWLHELVLAASVGLTACAPMAPPASPEQMPAGSAVTTPFAVMPVLPPTYDLQPGDELDVRYGDQSQFDREAVRIRPDGNISLPYVGTVAAAGLTPQALELELRQRHAALARPGEERRYLLQAGDELELKFPYAAALNESIRLRPDGRMQLQLIGVVDAAGRTPEQLQAELDKRYARYIRKPSVAVIVRNTTTQMFQVGDQSVRAGIELLSPTVMLRSAAPRQVFVGGEVQRPGVLVYRPGLTLAQALIEAGGRRPTGNEQRVTVLRRDANGAPSVVERDLSTLIPQDMALAPSDVVMLPKTRVAGVSEMLDEYVFKLFPFIRNSSFSYVYDLRGRSIP